MGETVKRLPLIVLENIISELSSTAQLNFNHRLFRQRQNICLKTEKTGNRSFISFGFASWTNIFCGLETNLATFSELRGGCLTYHSRMMMNDVVTRAAYKNRRTIGRRGLKLVEQMASKGMSLTSIAKALKIHGDTFAKIRKRQPEVSEVLERGYARMEDDLVDALYTRAMDMSSKGGTTAAIFLLKTRRGYEGTKVPSHITVVNNDNRSQVVQLPDKLSEEAYIKKYAKVGLIDET